MPDRHLSRRRFLALAGECHSPLAPLCPMRMIICDRMAPLPPLKDASSDDILQRQFALQQALSESPLTAGNQVRLLRDGQEAFAAMFDAMRQARDHINLEYFILEDIRVGQTQLSDLLIGSLPVASRSISSMTPTVPGPRLRRCLMNCARRARALSSSIR